MGRPGKQTVDYFPHYAGASDGKTLFVLQNRFHNDGYAFWFKLLEILSLSEGHYYNYQKPADWQFLLAKTGVSADIGMEILAALADVEAIDKELYEHKVIWCQKFVDNLADLYKRRKIGFPSKPIVSANNNLIDANNNPISTGDNTQSKVKESKLKESKEEENTPSLSNLSPSKEDAIEVYRENFGEPSEDMENELKLACVQFSPTWVIDAIQEVVKRGKKYWRYIARILKNWESERRLGKNTKSKQDPNKYVKGKYGSSVRR